MAETAGGEGRVAGLLVRPAKGEEPVLLDEVVLVEGGGLEGDHADRPSRGVTLITRDGWAEATAACGAPDLPWQTRRANVLLEGLDLLGSVGGTLRLGACLLHVESTCPPCHLMDKARPGLRQALEKDPRNGVCARVVRGGPLRVGEPALLGPEAG